MNQATEATKQAVQTYIQRRDRFSHPDGTFDSAGRWEMSDSERCDCCAGIRTPSRRWPYSELLHCRTLAHCCALHGADQTEARRYLRTLEPPKRLQGDAFKAVAVVDGRYLSIYDGETEYRLGQAMTEAVRIEHGGGFYVYETEAEARKAAVPRNSKLKDAPRAILKLKCSGTYTRYDSGKIAFSTVTPIEVLA
jgi:hypothetical protein